MTKIDWAKLRHAYGSAVDIPGLLTRARSAPAPTSYRDEPWYSLWSSLYHQDDIYSASYAALPELIAIATDCAPDIATQALFLAASIELRRNEPGAPELPADLRDPYFGALPPASSRSAELLQHASDPHAMLVIADAVFRGQFTHARTLLDADS